MEGTAVSSGGGSMVGTAVDSGVGAGIVTIFFYFDKTLGNKFRANVRQRHRLLNLSR